MMVSKTMLFELYSTGVTDMRTDVIRNTKPLPRPKQRQQSTRSQELQNPFLFHTLIIAIFTASFPYCAFGETLTVTVSLASSPVGVRQRIWYQYVPVDVGATVVTDAGTVLVQPDHPPPNEIALASSAQLEMLFVAIVTLSGVPGAIVNGPCDPLILTETVDGAIGATETETASGLPVPL